MIIVLPNNLPPSRRKGKLTLKELTESDKNIINLKKFYSHYLYESLEISILISLNRLAEACGYKLEMFYNQDDEFVNKLFPEDRNLREDSFIADFVRLKSFDDMVLNSVPARERRSSLSSTISKATWTSDRLLPNAFLK
jgi:hypothetical protein